MALAVTVPNGACRIPLRSRGLKPVRFRQRRVGRIVSECGFEPRQRDVRLAAVFPEMFNSRKRPGSRRNRRAFREDARFSRRKRAFGARSPTGRKPSAQSMAARSAAGGCRRGSAWRLPCRGACPTPPAQGPTPPRTGFLRGGSRRPCFHALADRTCLDHGLKAPGGIGAVSPRRPGSPARPPSRGRAGRLSPCRDPAEGAESRPDGREPASVETAAGPRTCKSSQGDGRIGPR